MKGMEDVINEETDTPCSWIGRILTKCPYSPNQSTIHCIPYQNISSISHRTTTNSCKFEWHHNRPQIVSAILREG